MDRTRMVRRLFPDLRMVRAVLAAAAVFSLLSSLLTVAAAPTSAAQPGSYYLAVGDSFSYGYLAANLPFDPNCHAADAPGFTCVFLRYLRRINPAIKIENLSEPGADSCELALGHRCYSSSPTPNPLDSAITFLKAHPGQVNPITVTIGGNDLLALYPRFMVDPSGTIALLPQLYSRLATDLDTILSRLRAADPSAEIIVTTQPNSLDGIGSPPLPGGVGSIIQQAIGTLNGVIESEARKHGDVVADAAAAFHAYPGGGARLTYVPSTIVLGDPSKIDIHPTAKGYAVYGAAVIAASGYAAPLAVTARLKRRVVRHGKKDVVLVNTAPNTLVSITVKLPKARLHVLGTSGSGGGFHHTFRVGHAAGRARVRVCAGGSRGTAICAKPIFFTVK